MRSLEYILSDKDTGNRLTQGISGKEWKEVGPRAGIRRSRRKGLAQYSFHRIWWLVIAGALGGEGML